MNTSVILSTKRDIIAKGMLCLLPKVSIIHTVPTSNILYAEKERGVELKDIRMVQVKTEQFQLKHKAILARYDEKIKELGSKARFMSKGGIYEEIADEFFLSGGYVAKVIRSQLKGA